MPDYFLFQNYCVDDNSLKRKLPKVLQFDILGDLQNFKDCPYLSLLENLSPEIVKSSVVLFDQTKSTKGKIQGLSISNCTESTAGPLKKD